MLRLRFLLAAAAVLVLTACGTGPGAADRTLTVFAAASLTDPLTALAREFEAAHPGIAVDLGLAGSSDLVAQITEGAPADVVALADEPSLAPLVDAGLVPADPPIIATNTLTIVAAPGAAAGVTGLADLAAPELSVVVCAPQVPCGAASRTVLDIAGVELTPVSEESKVTDVLGKVTSGEADAGLVYVTDARAAGDVVDVVAFPESAAAVNRYPAAVVADAAEPEAAQDFVDLLASEQGRRAFAAAGFGPP